MQRLINSFGQVGITSNIDLIERKRISLSNYMAISLALIGAFYVILFLILEIPQLGLTLSTILSGFLMALYFNKVQKYFIAKCLIVITFNTAVITFSYILPDAYVKLMLTACCITPFMLFSSKEVWVKYMGFILPLFAFALLHFGPFQDPGYVEEQHQVFLSYFEVPKSFIMIFGSVSYLDFQDIFYEKSLQNELREKGAVLEEYQASMEELMTTQEHALELEKEKQLAVKEALFKDNFLSNISHEIRTPLNGIIGMLDVLEDTETSDQQKDYIKTIKTSSVHLHTIINDVLDLSKIQAGKMQLEYSVFDIHELIQSSIQLFEPIAAEKHIQIHLDFEKNIPTFIKSDKTKISQILHNLISNALKFTEEGQVDIHAAVINHKFRISVTDTGIGISEDNLSILFKKFEQLDNSLTKKYKGTGLGLSICKELVKMLHGSMEVDSVFGKGSTFTFDFEFEESASEEQAQINELKLITSQNLNVLLVEDIKVNQKVAELILNGFNCNVDIANNGQEALDLFEDQKYDLILMDIQMPIMDGITATQKLRSGYQHLPIIIGLSANAMEGDKERYLSKGLDDYITKPITKAIMEQKIKQYFS